MFSNLTLTQFALLVGITGGILLGLIPLILGFKKQNAKFGIIGFVLTVIAGSIFSFLGSIPVAAIFAWLIVRKPKVEETPPAAENQVSGD